MDDLMLRPTARQLCGLLAGAGISLGAAAVLLVAGPALRVTEWGWAAAALALTFAVVYLLKRGDVAALTAAGLRSRNFGRANARLVGSRQSATGGPRTCVPLSYPTSSGDGGSILAPATGAIQPRHSFPTTRSPPSNRT
ncbi:hypothetical protein ACFLIM_28015 [Nonomuraea sp. M3C6]|uniref:Uncharacterized protein n=1 Tax=Nonomuraea marmarensis TaxID=3351344 RepID=A0ABW7AI77_9ACTN